VPDRSECVSLASSTRKSFGWSLVPLADLVDCGSCRGRRDHRAGSRAGVHLLDRALAQRIVSSERASTRKLGLAAVDRARARSTGAFHYVIGK
jgi:hypothetical protein